MSHKSAYASINVSITRKVASPRTNITIESRKISGNYRVLKIGQCRGRKSHTIRSTERNERTVHRNFVKPGVISAGRSVLKIEYKSNTNRISIMQLQLSRCNCRAATLRISRYPRAHRGYEFPRSDIDLHAESIIPAAVHNSQILLPLILIPAINLT